MSNHQNDVAIVGAGPAGTTAAHRLAMGGARVIVFDPSHPREKPCGGGISARARTMFPELEALVSQGKTGTSLRLVSPAGRITTVQGSGQTFAVEKEILDKYLLDLFQDNFHCKYFQYQESLTNLCHFQTHRTQKKA